MTTALAMRLLVDLCEAVTVGHVGKTSEFYRAEGVPFLRTQNVGKGELILDDLKFITQEFHGSLKKSQLKSGDVLVTRVVTDEMKCGIVPASLGQANCANVILIRPKPELSPEFLSYLITSPIAQSYLLERRVGSAQQVVNTKVLKDWPVPKLPIGEQKRIVAVLDRAFAALDRARAHAEANLADAQALLENSLNEVFRELATTDPVVRLEDAVHPDCKLSYGIVQPGDDVETGLPIVRPVDLKQRVITLAGLKSIAPYRADGYARTKLVGDELLLCVRGSTGELSIASPELAGGNVTRGIVPIRFEDDKVLREFAYFQFRSRYVRDQIAAKTYGAALMQINIKDLRQLNFVVPSISQQREAVERAEDLYERSHKLRSVYSNKLSDLANLRQSLLQRAFSGQL